MQFTNKPYKKQGTDLKDQLSTEGKEGGNREDRFPPLFLTVLRCLRRVGQKGLCATPGK